MNRIATAGCIVAMLGRKLGHMSLSREWRVIAAAICLLATAKPIAAVTFNLNFVAGANNPNDPTGSGLMSIMRAAADRWADIIEDSHTMTIDVSYATSCPVGGIACAGVVLPNVTLNRTVLGTIKVDPTRNWYFDPTPGDDSEFDFTQTLHRDLTSSQKTAGYSGTNIEPLLEVGFGGADNGSDPNVAGKSDMLTAALHEIGHLLGVTGNLSAGFIETLDGDYDLPPSLLAGRTMAVKAIPGNEAHFVDLFPLMAPSAGAPRVLASAADVLAAAAVSGWSQIDYSQKVFRTGTAWETAANWMGNRVPGIQDHATLRHGGSVSITTNAGVAGLLVGNSSQLTVRGTLIANGNVTINGGALTRDSTANFILSPFKTMMIENGGQATFSGDYNLSANATYNVTGADSTWTIGSEFRVGVASTGTGTLLIEDGGAVSNFNGYVGYSAGVDGDVTVAGVGSTWTNSSGLFVGYDGKGTLMIEGGAAVNSSSGFVGLFAGSDGKVTVTGFNPGNFDGSTWTTSSLSVGGDVQPGGTGYVKVLQLGIVEVNGDVKVWENGAIDIESRGKFIANGNVTVSGGLLTRYANGNFSLGAGKTMTVENGGVATFLDSYSTASNATYNITGIDSRLDAVVDCTLSIINGATVNVSSGGLLFDTTAIQVGFSNGTDGTLNVVGRSGLIASTVTLTGSSTLIVGHSTSGTAAINIGTTSSGAVFDTGSGLTTINKTGTVTIGSTSTSGTLNANGDVLIDGGVLNHNGGTFTLAAGKNLTAQNNGSFSFTGTYLITGGSTYTIQSGAHFSTTATTFGNGTLVVDGIGSTLAVSAATQLGSSGLTGTLTVRDKAAADFNGVLGLADGSTSHLSGGILNVESGATITTANIRIAPNSTNGQTGTFTVGNGVSTSRVTQDANATLVVGGNPTTGPVPNSGTLNLNSGGEFNSGAGTGMITINRTGTVNVASGGTLNADGNVTINGGVLTRTSAGTFSLAGGKTMTVQNDGTASFSGSYTTASNAIYNVSGIGSRLEAVAGTLSIINGAQVNVSSGASLFATATIQVGFSNGTGGTLIVDGAGSSATTSGSSAAIWGFGGSTAIVTFQNNASGVFSQVSLAHSTIAGTTGIVTIQSGADLTLTNNLALAALGGATTSAALNVQGSGSTLTQTGGSTLTVGAATGVAAINIGTTISGGLFTTGTGTTSINKTGTVTIGSGTNTGTLNANGNVTIDGGLLQVGTGSSVIVAPVKSMSLVNAGTLKGLGNVSGTVVNSSGVVSPGNSPGTLSITGNYTQSTGGKLAIELAGTSPGSGYDQLLVSGSATLAGSLDVSLIAFTPQFNQQFTILTAGSIVNNGFVLAGSAASSFSLVVSSTSVILQAIGLPGDYNHNSTVDAADYVMWRKTDGTSTGYNTWRTHFGPTNGSGPAMSTNVLVPEPTTLVLLQLGMIALFSRRRATVS